MSTINDKVTVSLQRMEKKQPPKELSVQEEKRLEQLENVVAENFQTFVQVGQALSEIRDRKLYRLKAVTFEIYCKNLFDIAKSRVRELINAAEVMENLRHGGGFDDEQKLLPHNERQVRPLTRLRPEQQVSAWSAAVESAPRGNITASHVNKMVKEYLGEKITKTVRQAQEKVSQTASTDFSEAFEKFSEQLLIERNSNYKYTSRGFIVSTLDQLRADLAEDGDLIDEPAFSGGSDDANKLKRAGYSLFRDDRTSMTIRRSDAGGWVKHSGPFETIKEMDGELKTILQDEKHLRG